MASVEGTVAVMAKVLESQRLVAEGMVRAARVMDQNAIADGGNSDGEAQAEISSAVRGLGSLLDTIV